MKYVKAGDPAPTPEQLADIKAKAIDQLDRYSADPALAKAWRLNSGASGTSGASGKSGTSGEFGLPPVALHRLVMVFHGGACVMSEEV